MWCALLPEEKASLEVWRETWRLLGMPVSELRLALLFPYIYTGVYTLFSFCPAPFQSCERCSTLVCEAGSGTFQLCSSWLLQCSCHSVSLASLTSLGFLQNLLAGFRLPHTTDVGLTELGLGSSLCLGVPRCLRFSGLGLPSCRPVCVIDTWKCLRRPETPQVIVTV